MLLRLKRKLIKLPLMQRKRQRLTRRLPIKLLLKKRTRNWIDMIKANFFSI